MADKEKDGYEEIIDGTAEDETTSNETTEVVEDKENSKDSEEEQPKEILITKEDAEKYGLSKGLIGKPISIMFEEYSNIRKLESKNAQNIATLTQQLGEFKEALTKKEVREIEEEVEEQLPDINKFFDETGYVTDVKGFNEALLKREELREKKLKKEFTKLLEEKEKFSEEKSGTTAKQVAQLQLEKLQNDLFDNVTEFLSELYSEEEITPELIDKVIKEYDDFLTEEDEEGRQNYARLYAGKPTKMAKAIILYHKANSFKKPTENEKAKEMAMSAHEKQLEKLKKSGKTFTGSSSSARMQQRESMDLDYDELLAEAEAERPTS